MTGSTGGLGLETAWSLASAGASVTISGRDPAKIEAALGTLPEQVPSSECDAQELAYAQSKTANIWFASELHRRFGEKLLSLSVHLGVIRTGLSRHLPDAVVEMMAQGFQKAGVVEKTIPQGAATSVWAATASELSGQGGAYLLDCQVAHPVSEENPRFGYAPWAFDREGSERLWTLSEELTGVKFA